MDKDKFKELLTTQFNVVDGDAPINVQKVTFGDVMFNIEKYKTYLENKISANKELKIQYTQEDNTEMIHYCQGKINTYNETKDMLDDIQQQIYKKVL
ncbi:MAG: hypothetical protein Unbinned1953contig1002_34 [Prokaryotic dsDNA virus sp.]|nr:MAG: hypothetical protein Unbinned1953contig1002_34 [Prokaryotic dsDNA virus sp.]|tara:strand:+ start:144 stop:434 length:291 start_codon:yes stop_codon:yes gene_type:complete